MHLTNRTDIAIRALMYLALNNDRIVSVDEVSEKTASHRSQVVAATQLLRKAGYIKSTVGRGGGIALAKTPSEIRVSSLVQLIEPDFALTECQANADTTQCGFFPTCPLRGALDDALQAFFHSLDQVSLADLVVDRCALMKTIVDHAE